MKRKLNTRGFGIMGATISVAVVTMIILGSLGWIQSVKKNQNRSFLQSSVTAIIGSVIDSLENDDAWFLTIQSNPSLACLSSPGNACASTPSPIIVKKADTATIVDTAASNAQTGFTFGGEVCSTFSNSPTNNDCPFRVSVVAIPCGPGATSCTSSGQLHSSYPFASDPAVQLTINIVFRPSNDNYGRLKEVGGVATNYTVTYFRGQKNVRAASACRMMGGTYNNAIDFCSIGYSNGNCNPSNTFIFQVDSSGSRSCLPIAPSYGIICGMDSAVVGIEPDGRYVCGKF